MAAGFFSVSFWNFNHSCSLLFSFLSFLLPIWKMPASRITAFLAKKKTFSFHLYFCFLPRWPPPSVSTIFTKFFLFRAPLTEMTRLLLIVLRCTQFNLSFRFTFWLQSLFFGFSKNYYIIKFSSHGMEKNVNFFSFTLWSHSCASLNLPWPVGVFFFRFTFLFGVFATQKTGYFRFSVLMRLWHSDHRQSNDLILKSEPYASANV